MTLPARVTCLLALVLLAGPPASAQQPTFLYTLRDTGPLLVNGTLLEKAPSIFDPTDTQNPHGEEGYLDLAVVGPDRFLLRKDGRVQKNGSKLHELPFTLATNAPFWGRMHVDGEGVVYAVRTDGMTACNGQIIATFDGFGFADLTTVPSAQAGSSPDVYALRFDGAVFRKDSPDSPGFKLEYDRNPNAPEPDGSSLDVQWLHLVYDELTGKLFGMRFDGVVMSLDPADFQPSSETSPVPPAGKLEAELPFNVAGDGSFYVGFELRPLPPGSTAVSGGSPSATWYALRRDGKLFSSTLAPPAPDGAWEFLVDLPGDGDTSSPYVDLSVLDGVDEFWSMRLNGRVYAGVDPEPLIDVKNGSLIRLAVSHSAPDGTKFKNRPPKAAIYKTKLIPGQSVTVPILLADPDKATEDLIVSVDLDKLPGGTFDAQTRQVSFPGAAEKGNFRFVVTADDGSGKKPKRFVYKIKVIKPDDNPDKNKAPIGVPIKKLLAFIDQEIRFPVLATDADGDALKIEVVDIKGDDIFDEQFGATFDSDTNTVTWTPAFKDIGKHKAVFLISDDGDPVRTRKLAIKLEVMSQLIFDVGGGAG